MKKKPEINIGMIGHVDHGKTTLTQAITGKWTDTFSEEIKRGITIKLGYANACFYFDQSKGEPEGYNTEGKGKFLRCVSFVDAPGHEALMTMMLAASSVMDGAILVVAANEGIRAQTREHAMAARIAGIKHVIVVQNKIDSVNRERALESYEEILKFMEEYGIDSPVIPVSALHRVNIDLVIEAIEKFIPTPKRNPGADPKFLVVRSFDVNKPGTEIKELVGGVLGGALVRGKLKVGEEIEIRPGIKVENRYEPVITEITSLATEGFGFFKEVTPGGSVAIGTKLDPSLTKRDAMMGNVVGKPGKMPPVWDSLVLDVKLFENVIGFEEKEIKVEPLRVGEPLLINVNTAVTVGIVKKAGSAVEIDLKKPICAEKSDRFVISRKVEGKWRLIGYGELE